MLTKIENPLIAGNVYEYKGIIFGIRSHYVPRCGSHGDYNEYILGEYVFKSQKLQDCIDKAIELIDGE